MSFLGMPTRHLPFLMALLCFVGLRVTGVAPGVSGEVGWTGTAAPHAALMLSCEVAPQKLTLPQGGLSLGMSDFTGVRLGAVSVRFCGVQWLSEVGMGKRMWRPVSRGPPGTRAC